MQPHEERVVKECSALEKKYFDLCQFIDDDSEKYKIVPLMEKERLHLQRYLMAKYYTVLCDRIKYFEETG